MPFHYLQVKSSRRMLQLPEEDSGLGSAADAKARETKK